MILKVISNLNDSMILLPLLCFVLLLISQMQGRRKNENRGPVCSPDGGYMLKSHHFSLCWWIVSAHNNTKAAQASKQQHFALALCYEHPKKEPSYPSGHLAPQGLLETSTDIQLHHLFT